MKKFVSWISVLTGIIFFMSILGGGVLASFAAQKVTIEFWGCASAEMDRGRRIIKYNFEKENPNVTVKMETYPWGEMTEKILTGAMAGLLPDVCRFGFTPRFASRGLLLPLDEYISGPDGIDTNDYIEGIFPNPALAWDGKIYALPHALTAYVLFYNRDILEREGIDVPQTWSEFRVAAMKLTQKGPNGDVKRYGLSIHERCNYLLNGFVATNGAYLTNVEGHEATEATYSAPENVEGFQFLVDLVKNKYLRQFPSKIEVEKFLDGTYSMYYSLDCQAYQFRPEIYPQFNWGVAPCPVPEGKPLVQPANFGGTTSFMFKNTKYPEIAWKFLKAYSWKDGAPVVWIHKYGQGMVFKDLLDPNTLHLSYYPYQMDPHLRALAEIYQNRTIKTNGPDQWHVRGDEIRQIERAQYDLMLMGEKSVKEALDYLDQKVGAMLPEK